MELLTIIFSKDRASQLDLLLRSFSRNDDQDVFENVAILYTVSNERFQYGYDILINNYYNDCDGDTYGIRWYKEQDFRTDLLNIIARHKPSHIVFMVDDMIMMRPLAFAINDGFNLLANQPVATISLRLGHNTYWQYQTNSETMMPTVFKDVKNGLYVWNRLTIPSTMNFNYPFSVDAHIFRTDLILPIIDAIPFTFPNDLEGGMQTHIHYAPPLMACQKMSAFINAPINRVQDKYPNRVGDTHSISSEELNDKFLDGLFIDYDSIDFDKVRGCHQELEMEFATSSPII